MKTFITFILFFCISLIFASTYDNQDNKKFIEKCLKPTVLIESEQVSASGTGFIVKSIKNSNLDIFVNIIFSCEHILKSKIVTVKTSVFDDDGIFKKYMSHKGVVLASDGINDLSILLFFSEDIMPTATINPSYKPKIRDAVFSIGHGLGEISRYSEGKFTGALISETNSEVNTYRTSIPIIFGDSGGPLFFENQVIGIANSMKSTELGQNKYPVYDISFYKPIYSIKKMLTSTNIMDENFDNTNVPEFTMLLFWSHLLEVKN